VQGQKKAAEAVSRAREELDRALNHLEVLANSDRERFSYSVHALNNYLMVVNTTLDLLSRTPAIMADRNAKRWLESLKQATKLMKSTARGVLTSINDSLPPLLLASVSMNEVAESACDAYQPKALRKKIRLIWEPTTGRDTVLTDGVAAGVVLDNLVSNAIKYSELGTEVSVEMTTETEAVVCSIRDSGPGLSVSDQERLFERGVQLSPRPTGGEPSNGYGLAISRDLALALGGQLHCRSALGKGTCFAFSLPFDVSPMPS